MRGFPFGTFSSFNSLSFGSMTGPSAEREAPYANSPVAIEIWSMKVAEIWVAKPWQLNADANSLAAIGRFSTLEFGLLYEDSVYKQAGY